MATHWCSSLALEAIDMKELVNTVMRIVLLSKLEICREGGDLDDAYTTTKWQMIMNSTISVLSSQLYAGHLSGITRQSRVSKGLKSSS